ncbi:MAG: aminotransferase class IV [Bacteroidota bacterium]
MYPFFETIRYEDAQAENLFFHQQRVERTYLSKGKICKLNLHEIKFNEIPEAKQLTNSGVYKCKLSYDLNGNYSIYFEPYSIRKIETFTLVEIGTNTYELKYTDRNWINNTVAAAKTDDVIFTGNGLIKDASYTNIALFDGYKWITPKSPMLMGTKRALLLRDRQIIEQDILVQQLKDFKKIKFINAMMHWDESPCIDL